MSSLRWVRDFAGRLAEARRGEAHESSPAFFVGASSFARLRSEDLREILQCWTGDLSTRDALAGQRDTVVRIDTFTQRVSVWAYLDLLEDQETAEMVFDSYLIRGPVGRRGLDLAPFLTAADP